MSNSPPQWVKDGGWTTIFRWINGGAVSTETLMRELQDVIARRGCVETEPSDPLLQAADELGIDNRQSNPSDELLSAVADEQSDPNAKHTNDLMLAYVKQLSYLRANSTTVGVPRDTYTVALGQLLAIGRIDEATWRAALDGEL